MSWGRIFHSTVFIVALGFPSWALAQHPALLAPSSLPLDDTREPAVDILYNGVLQTSDDLKALRKKGVELSDLQPPDTTDLWSNLPLKAAGPGELAGPVLDEKLDSLTLDAKREVLYEDFLKARMSNFRFTVRQSDPLGVVRTYRIMPSKNAHAFLLRKNFLRKLGYHVPPIQYLPTLQLRFKNEVFKKDFLKKLSGGALADTARWVTNLSDKSDLTLLKLQDVIAFDAEDPFYNLGIGYLDGMEHIRGRRLLNSLLVPYNIMNLQETVEGLDYIPARQQDRLVITDFEPEDGRQFTTPREDVIWILKRIGPLTRADFTEIVEKSYFPPPVAALLVEKLISRRNWLIQKFDVKFADPAKRIAITQEIPFNSKISLAPDLIEGSLQKETWDGYASRFAYTDPESPLSKVEIRAFFKAKGLSALIDSAINALDRQFLPGTDIEKKILDKQYEEAKNQFINFLKTGKVEKVPFGFKTFPTIDGDIGVSRDIVTGDYMGTDNLIQLADTFEYVVKPGVLSSIRGLPSGVQLNLGAELRMSQSYTHLRNIKSIRRALKEPFKNMLVSMLKKQFGHTFEDLLSPEYSVLLPEQKNVVLAEIMKNFNESMGTGDSFIISRNIGLTGFLGGGYALQKNIDIQAAVNKSRIAIWRLHILKLNENTIHIYKDFGDLNITGFNLGVRALIPIITISFGKTKGKGDADFYGFDLTPNLTANPSVEENMLALRTLLVTGSLESVKALQTPFRVHNNFSEKTSGLNFLFLKRFGVKGDTEITITKPAKDEVPMQKAQFVRSTSGTRVGNDYQGLAVDIINAVLEDIFDLEDVQVPNPGSGDPGDTFKGHSSMRNAAMELEVTNSGSDELSPPFFKTDYRWQGWKTKPKRMLELVAEVNRKFGYTMFDPKKFENVTSFQLYSIDVSVFLYENAIFNAVAFDAKTLTDMMWREGDFHLPPPGPRFHKATANDPDVMKARMIKDMLKDRGEFLRLYEQGNKHEAVKRGLKFLELIELVLPFYRFVEVVGGAENMYVYGRAMAFREGNENGDKPIDGQSFGRLVDEKARGGLTYLQTSSGMTPGEFFFYWLMRKL